MDLGLLDVIAIDLLRERLCGELSLTALCLTRLTCSALLEAIDLELPKRGPEVPLVHMLEKKVLVPPRCLSIEKSLSRAGDEPYVDLQKIAEDGSLPFQSQDPLVILEIKRAFCQLLRKHCADELKDEVQPGGSSIEVSYLLLSQEVPMLAIWVADVPKTLLPLLAEAATELWACPIRHVRVSGLPLDDKLQDLCESHRDALVKVCRRRCARAAHALPLVLPCPARMRLGSTAQVTGKVLETSPVFFSSRRVRLKTGGHDVDLTCHECYLSFHSAGHDHSLSVVAPRQTSVHVLGAHRLAQLARAPCLLREGSVSDVPCASTHHDPDADPDAEDEGGMPCGGREDRCLEMHLPREHAYRLLTITSPGSDEAGDSRATVLLEDDLLYGPHVTAGSMVSVTGIFALTLELSASGQAVSSMGKLIEANHISRVVGVVF